VLENCYIAESSLLANWRGEILWKIFWYIYYSSVLNWTVFSVLVNTELIVW
jgi:hypothetical protein